MMHVQCLRSQAGHCSRKACRHRSEKRMMLLRTGKRFWTPGCSRKGHQSRNKTSGNSTCTEQMESFPALQLRLFNTGLRTIHPAGTAYSSGNHTRGPEPWRAKAQTSLYPHTSCSPSDTRMQQFQENKLFIAHHRTLGRRRFSARDGLPHSHYEHFVVCSGSCLK